VFDKLHLHPDDSERSLAGSYANCNPEDNTDHLAHLLNLEGTFDCFDKCPASLGCAHARGISFGLNLVTASTRYWIDNQVDWKNNSQALPTLRCFNEL
jgi:hypothetical protein